MNSGCSVSGLVSSKRRSVSPELREEGGRELRSGAGEGTVEIQVKTLRVADVQVAVRLGRKTTAQLSAGALAVRRDVFGSVFGGLEIAAGERGKGERYASMKPSGTEEEAFDFFGGIFGKEGNSELPCRALSSHREAI